MNKYYFWIIFIVTTYLFIGEVTFSDSLQSGKETQTDNRIFVNQLSAQIDSLKGVIDLKTDEIQFKDELLKLEYRIRVFDERFDGEIKRLNDEIRILKSSIIDDVKEINSNILEKDIIIEELKKKVYSISDNVSATKNNLSLIKSETEARIIDIDDTISKRTLYWIIALSFVLLLVSAVFYFLRIKVVKQSKSLSKEIESTREKLESEAIQLDTKLVQILEQKLDIANMQKGEPHEPDHSFPNKVCEEIQRIRNRLKHMQQDEQATKVIRHRLGILEEKLNEMGYEIVNLEGKHFIEGMTVNSHFILDENLHDGERIITRVIKPQINFNNVLIQAADVEVSQG